MHTEDADDLVAFHRVRVIESTGPALFCAIENKRVWLPRHHIRGNLWNRGDHGTLMVRRWIALDRHLAVPSATDGFPIVVDVAERPNQSQPRALAAVPSGASHGH
jgi:hypothetical protein